MDWSLKRKVEDVVWDCVRLELAADHYSCDRLFILAGEKEKVYKALESRPFNPKTSRALDAYQAPRVDRPPRALSYATSGSLPATQGQR